MSQVKVSCGLPLCPAELQKTHKNGVEIDYCPHCKGVWLDKGELDKIMAAEEQEVRRIEDYHYDAHKKYQHQPYDPYYKHHKKKSMWKDLFDFD